MGGNQWKSIKMTISKKLFAEGKIDADFNNLIAEKDEVMKSITVSTPEEKINNFIRSCTC